MVEKTSFMFLTGPEVIKAVTGEVIDAEALGGSDVHTSVSGVAHMSVETEKDALDMVRHFLSYLPSNNVENPPYKKPDDDPAYMDDALNSIVPLDPSEPYSMHQVIEKIVDQGSFLEFQPNWGRNAIVGLARIGGHSVGVVGQEPAMMAGRIAAKMANDEDQDNFILMHAMGANTAGQLGSVITGGILPAIVSKLI